MKRLIITISTNYEWQPEDGPHKLEALMRDPGMRAVFLANLGKSEHPNTVIVWELKEPKS